jgi:hypothetical protein
MRDKTWSRFLMKTLAWLPASHACSLHQSNLMVSRARFHFRIEHTHAPIPYWAAEIPAKHATVSFPRGRHNKHDSLTLAARQMRSAGCGTLRCCSNAQKTLLLDACRRETKNTHISQRHTYGARALIQSICVCCQRAGWLSRKKKNIFLSFEKVETRCNKFNQMDSLEFAFKLSIYINWKDLTAISMAVRMWVDWLFCSFRRRKCDAVFSLVGVLICRD